MQSRLRAFLVAMSVSTLAVGMVLPAHAKSNVVPDYEIKLLVDPGQTLTTDHQPTAAFRTLLELSTTAGTESFQYFDTTDRQLQQQGWLLRIRRTDHGDQLKLTFKKRYKVTDGDIDAAADQANADGFDSTDTNYPAQVNWGYAQQVLDLANDKKASAKNYEDLPDTAESKKLLLDALPGKLENWTAKNWGRERVEEGRVHGPVTASTYTGRYEGTDLDVEVLPVQKASGVGIEYLVEVSEKAADHDTAAASRTALIDALDSKGWLLHKDQDKTSLVLERY